MDTVYSILSGVPWIVGGGLGTGALVAAAAVIFLGARPVLDVLASIVDMFKPIGVGASEGVVAVCKLIWDGIGLAFTNPKVFAPMLVVVMGATIFLAPHTPYAAKERAALTITRCELASCRKLVAPKPRLAPRQSAKKPGAWTW